ncbi:unnamed protein product [Didymodactylos carnosus]|uniref:WWE domain-containing protein n=1 Tax=Didymodactylos carnosus TaxID=1234261 RepID=A0A814E8V8_9BILA|nr:unnamed protein product [Didymodactylos carnosus]CAF3739417.1 unnamed protein product [Didymodactylos carnosus]
MASQAIKAADQPRFQWYWKSNSDPWSTNGKEEWTKYSDIESAIIEQAFIGKNKTKLVELDNYSINLNDSIQISKSDPNKQRPIKRVLISRNESQGLREERFFLPPTLSKTFSDDSGKDAYTFLSEWKNGNKPSDAEIVKQAANGIIIEGKQLGQHFGEDLTLVKGAFLRASYPLSWFNNEYWYNPDVALDKTANLIRQFKEAYPDTKLILTTLPLLGILGSKSSVDQVRADNDEYNSRLLALYDDIDVINVAFDENMPLRDGIHLNSCDTKELQKSM